MSSMYIWWLFFSWDLWSLHPPLHFLSTWFSGIITITNSNGDNESVTKIPLKIFTSAKLFPPAVCSTLQFSMIFSINFMTSSDILYILRQSTTHLYETISYAFFLSTHVIARFFHFVLILRMCWSMLEDH